MSVSRTIVAQPVRDLDEQLVAAVVPERVVDLLEAVDVEQQQADVVALRLRVAATARSSRSASRRRLGSPVSGSSRARRAFSAAEARSRWLALRTVRNSSSHSTSSPSDTITATLRTASSVAAWVGA